MTDHEQQPPAAEEGATAAPPARRGQRRKIALIGTGGAAVVLAGGALLATQSNDSQQSLPEPAAMAPLSTATPPASESAPATMAASEAAPSSPAAPVSVPPSTAQPKKKEGQRPARTEAKSPEQARKEVKEARAKAAADGVPLKRPLKQKAAAEVAVNERTVTSESGTIRVTTAHGDLTGQRALSIAADDGERVGDGVRCTNKVRFSEGVPAKERPTLLLCWRTSAKRSVVTMAVAPQGKPAPAESIALIRQEWTKLG